MNTMKIEYEQVKDFYIHRSNSGFMVFKPEGQHVATFFNRSMAETWINSQYEVA